jgi:hypothetical protein
LGRSSCPESVDILRLGRFINKLGPRSGIRSEVPDCSRNEDAHPRKNAVMVPCTVLSRVFHNF